MPAPSVRSDYSALSRIARGFSNGAEATRSSLQQLRSSMSTLMHGDWVGQGARVFFREMDSEVLPAVQRLQAALEAAARAAVALPPQAR
jgi:WXG100 family type VII secretion target